MERVKIDKKEEVRKLGHRMTYPFGKTYRDILNNFIDEGEIAKCDVCGKERVKLMVYSEYDWYYFLCEKCKEFIENMEEIDEKVN